MKSAKIFITVFTLTAIILCSLSALPANAAIEKSHVLAHWKLQNVTGYYTGSIETDDLQFIDLSGNGNDLVTSVAGNGDKLDIFTWDEGDKVGATIAASALKMNNTKKLAATVDPYSASETSWTGGYTSGKYLETIRGAMLNALEFDDGEISVEIIFKLSEELDNNYNRYAGMFSRQGVIDTQNEPPFSIAISEWDNDASGTIGENQTTLQYIHCDDITKQNVEFSKYADGLSARIGAGVWHHVLLTTDGIDTFMYLDGQPLQDIPGTVFGITAGDPEFGWEVGVGRKSSNGHLTDSQNEDSPEGMIRRLFAGSISEIRVLDKMIDVDDSLYYNEVTYTDIPSPAQEKDPAPKPDKPVETDPPKTDKPKTAAPKTDPATTTQTPDTTGDTDKTESSNTGLIIGIVAGVIVVAGGVAACVTIIKKKKKE